uniref:Uncharacterized protein n=1 Tax=viral metagenome TaxID=1070528 RepID=A0A6H1ZU16_9ZZZZ
MVNNNYNITQSIIGGIKMKHLKHTKAKLVTTFTNNVGTTFIKGDVVKYENKLYMVKDLYYYIGGKYAHIVEMTIPFNKSKIKEVNEFSVEIDNLIR